MIRRSEIIVLTIAGLIMMGGAGYDCARKKTRPAPAEQQKEADLVKNGAMEATRSAPAEQEEINWIKNSGFEEADPEKPRRPKDWNSNVPDQLQLITENSHSGQNCLKIAVQGDGYFIAPALTSALELGKVYRLSFWYKVTTPHPFRQIWFDDVRTAPLYLDVRGYGKRHYGYASDWQEVVYYFSPEEERDFGNFGLRFNKSGEISAAYIDDVHLREIGADDYSADNFFLDGSFENGGYELCNTSHFATIGPDEFAVSVDNNESMEGDCALKIEIKVANKRLNLESSSFPVLPGKSYVFEFWAKSMTSPFLLTVTFDGGRPDPQKKHWYIQQQYNLGKTWKRYALEFSAPNEDNADFYTPLRKFVALRITTANTAGTIWLDALKFGMKK